jgi:hypothetical protein
MIRPWRFAKTIGSVRIAGVAACIIVWRRTDSIPSVTTLIVSHVPEFKSGQTNARRVDETDCGIKYSLLILTRLLRKFDPSKVAKPPGLQAYFAESLPPFTIPVSVGMERSVDSAGGLTPGDTPGIAGSRII